MHGAVLLAARALLSKYGPKPITPLISLMTMDVLTRRLVSQVLETIFIGMMLCGSIYTTMGWSNKSFADFKKSFCTSSGYRVGQVGENDLVDDYNMLTLQSATSSVQQSGKQRNVIASQVSV